MIFFKTVKTSFTGLMRNKLRMFLTMLGVIIGVGAVLTMISVGKGARDRVAQSMNELGTDVLFIRPGAANVRHIAQGTVKTLTYEDGRAILEKIPEVIRVSCEYSGQAQVKYMNNNSSFAIVGTTPEFLQVRSFYVDSGVFFTQMQMVSNSCVAVIGVEVAKKLFNNLDPLDKFIKIKGINFRVIGIMQEKGSSGGWNNPDEQIYVPLNTAQKRLFGEDHVQSISVKINDSKNIEIVREKMEKLLSLRHRIQIGKELDFNVRSAREILQRWDEMTSAFSILLGAIASVSLIVGGIGIMNIMLVTVTERRREIGIRKSIGARKKDILKQFLVESLVIGFLGGVIGVLLGILASVMVARYSQWETLVSPEAIILAFFFALLVACVFGIYPAMKAANQNPIEAIRYE